jgi:hypothetical protein
MSNAGGLAIRIERWVGLGLLIAERQFRKVIGHRQIPLLLSAMAGACGAVVACVARLVLNFNRRVRRQLFGGR